MKYLPLILLVATAQAQTLYTCGTKQADPKHCLAAKLCVTSNTTHKAYCGATMAAAEAQEMAHEPKPLVCPKYQHEEKTPARCANTCLPESTVCTTECLYVDATDECVDDMHEVTEKEWQAILKQLNRIDAERLPRPAIADSKGGLVIHYKASDIKPGEACPSGMHWAQGNSYFDSLPHDKNGNVIAGTYWGNGDDPATADYYFCERNK